MEFSFLHKETSLFVDLEMMFDVDSFICKTMYNFLVSNQNDDDPFIRLKATIDKYGEEYLNKLYLFRQTENILFDFMKYPDKRKADETRDFLLYNDAYDLGSYSRLKLTKIGTMLSVVIKDKNIKKIYVYVNNDRLPDALYDHIYGQFNGNLTKISILYGDKIEAMKHKPCNEYMFSMIGDAVRLNMIKPESRHVSVYVPEYPHNMNPENKKRVWFPVSPSVASDKYHLLLITLALPITND